MLELDFAEEVTPVGPQVGTAMVEEKRWLGIYDHLPFDEYKKAPGVNISFLKKFHESPATAITEKRHPKPPTAAMRLGTALHTLVFEPKVFEATYIKGKYDEYRTKKAKAWKAEIEQGGKIVLKTSPEPDFWNPPEWDHVHLMRDSLMNDPIASVLIETSVFERSFFWVDPTTYKLCKGRLDGYSEAHRMIVDLKSAADSSYSGFAQSVLDFGYHRQEDWYMRGCRAPEVNMDVSNGFVFIVVESSRPPYQVQMYHLEAKIGNYDGDGYQEPQVWQETEWLRVARELNNEDMAHYRLCHKFDVWPGYGDRVVEDSSTPSGYRVETHGARRLDPLPWVNRLPIY